MRQAVMTEPGKIEFGEAEEPKAGAGEILLRIKRIGVCGSDIHVYHGKHPFTPYPVVQGHEYSGVVEAVGEGVEDVKPGTLATARPQLVCGKCGPCRRGDYNVCEKLRVQGFQAPGCAQDLFVVPKDRFVPLPKSLTVEQGALVEPASVGAHSTARASDVAGKNAIVLGAGTIGNMVAQFVRCRGAKNILITDISDYRLEIARKCGIKNTSNAGKESLADAVKRVFGEEGFQVAFEAAGVEATLSAAIANIEKGGEIVVLGVFGEKPCIDMSVVGEHELSLIGTLMYKHEDYVEAAQMISEGKIITEPLV
ncbi:MAG: alcohol dehydrogenase catalytic domain-containing protein, partial [Planctomycetota bacterium]